MLTLGVETIVILLLIVGAVSAFGGYVVAQERQRRAGGGKSAAELRKELGEYKENVNTHFQTTAGLLHDMTEQYRAVYEHMASGAQNLCDPDTARTQIESLRAGLLPAGVPDATPVSSADPQPEPREAPATSGVTDDDAAAVPAADDDVAASTGTDEMPPSADPSDDAMQTVADPTQSGGSSEIDTDTVARNEPGPDEAPQGHGDESGLGEEGRADTNGDDKEVKT